jgi:hypothetical protein
VAFHSQKFQPAEINYYVYDKEMTAIMAAINEWEHLLQSIRDYLVVNPDHKILEYTNSSKILKHR